MIEKIGSFDGLEYISRVNHGHDVFMHGTSVIDSYVYPADGDLWSKCPCCNQSPKVWTFNNGRSTACGCGNTRYDHFSVHAESIMSVHSRTGSSKEYSSDDLRNNWNEYCATMINPCSHGDLFFLGRW